MSWFYENPVYRGTASVVRSTAGSLGLYKSSAVVQVKDNCRGKMGSLILGSAGRTLVRVAGISGALAVGLGAYGAHALLNKPDVNPKMKAVFETANKYHFLHTLALLAVPFAGKPLLVGCLMIGGMSIFCSTCYYYAITEKETFNKFTPYGGTMLIVAWLSFLL